MYTKYTVYVAGVVLCKLNGCAPLVLNHIRVSNFFLLCVPSRFNKWIGYVGMYVVQIEPIVIYTIV